MGLKNKIERSVFHLQVWFWAASQSKYFCRCHFKFIYAPIEIRLDWRPTNKEIVVFRLVFNRIYLWFFIPDEVYEDFEIARNQQGSLNRITIDDIPF